MIAGGPAAGAADATWRALLAALPLALVHALSRHLGALDGTPRHRLLSAAGGASVAYVFVQLLPGLGRGQAAFERLRAGGALGAGALAAVSNHVYVVALASFLLFYGLTRLASSRAGGGAGRAVFWLHAGSFALTNALTGFLLVQRAEVGGRALAVFVAAMTLWFVVNDRALHAHYGARYDRVGRWVLAAALLAGWAVGAFVPHPPPLAPVLLQAVIAGSVLLNVLTAEVPRDQRSKFWPFALGAAGYGALLLAL